MKYFDHYELIAVLTPGALFLVSISLLYEPIYTFLEKPNFSIGDFGILILIAYVIGHILQGLGNLLEEMYWRIWQGKPTDWIRTNKHRLISDGQIRELELKLKGQLTLENAENICDLTRVRWAGLVSRICSEINIKQYDKRAYLFNGNYGLMRGVSAALLVILILFLINNITDWSIGILIFLGFAIALFRMHRFGIYYAREVFISYLYSESEKPETNNKGKK